MSVKVVKRDLNSNRCDIQANADDIPVSVILDNDVALDDGSTLWEMDGEERFWVLHDGVWIQKA